MGSTGLVTIFNAAIAVDNNANKAVTERNTSVDNHSPGGTTLSIIFPDVICLVVVFCAKVTANQRPLFEGVQSRSVWPARIRSSSSVRSSSEP